MKSALPTLTASNKNSGMFVDAFGSRYVRIAHAENLPPFLMNVVSPSDLWLFLASNGGLTAGRVNAEQALFPYRTVDRIYDSVGSTGPFTAIRVEAHGEEVLWEPFATHTSRVQPVERRIYKSIEGDRVWFEEIQPALQLIFRYGWCTAGSHGFVRHCELENSSPTPIEVRLLDGLRNLLPPGINGRLQSESSCLVDAYKTAELLSSSSLAVYSLAAGITDRTTPLESLRASIVWSEGLPEAEILLSEMQLRAFHRGASLTTETHCRGVRGTYALASTVPLAPLGRRAWLMVADIGLSQADVAVRRQALAAGELVETVHAAIDESTRRLRSFVALSDGLQTGGAESTTAHHFANTLFNIMRGGVFVHGYDLSTRDFAAFVRIRNRPVADRHATLFAALPETLNRAELLARLAKCEDVDLDRLALEYLPLTFSRRHGDPSRPWNRFNIRVRDEAGEGVLNHEGNWRDIFQNWEALCLSFPEFFESVVAKFLNASTVDGYNPYRISRDGIEWETPDQENPWASIGYWGDHQTVYLLKLLEWSHRFHPTALSAWLRRDLFSYADVPYRIASFQAMLHDPHATIEFDETRHHATEALVADVGTDGRLVHHAGRIVHVNLTEKLLVLVLTRLTNFVPGGGIWMNTQRPEWNDANNALVGYGVSMVTLCYLRRLLNHLRTVFVPALGAESATVSSAVAELAAHVTTILETHRSLLVAAAVSAQERRSLTEALANAGAAYRAAVYRETRRSTTDIPPRNVAQLLEIALAFVDHTIHANRRPDGLYHAYNLLEFTEDPPALKLNHLASMLEGQVAVLSAGVLSAAETVDVLKALRLSPLYRADQHSYLLYPDRLVPGFLERNILRPESVAAGTVLGALLDAGDTRLVLRDCEGAVRFNPDLVSRDALRNRLQLLANDPRWSGCATPDWSQVTAIYEDVFGHRTFTGRSGTMFGYEGLGCVYWHMVAKLMLAVQENLEAAHAVGDPAAAELTAFYYDVRSGLGFNKSAESYGAFPTDPYSHTPGHSGAQQPGMTGQVKEEILTRFSELGVGVEEGTIRFDPRFLRAEEFTTIATTFRYVDRHGEEALRPLPAGALAFTFCGVPVIYQLSNGERQLLVHFARGDSTTFTGGSLDISLSQAIFRRSTEIVFLNVNLGCEFRPLLTVNAPAYPQECS